MTNHPNRSDAGFRLIAFSTITGSSLAHAATAPEALQRAIEAGGPGMTDDFIEVLDCGVDGRKVWTGDVEPPSPVALHKARELHRAVFRGAGFAEPNVPGRENFQPIALAAGGLSD